MKAEWIKYLDMRSTQFCERPCCPECSERYEPTPIVFKDDKYICLNCHEEVEVDKKQKKWIDDHTKTRTKMDRCIMCGAYKMDYVQRRDIFTNKWVTVSGSCRNCGCKLRV